MEELISVVVPVYNVKNYLKRCLESIIAQDYANYEVILVDDGSTDGSGVICDLYSQKYSNFTVVHKKNGGLSSARNASFPYIHGKYITFIDSDDWIEHNMLSTMYKNLKANSADVSVVGYFIAKDEGKHPYFKDTFEKQVMNRKMALRTYLYYDGLGVTIWGKLWKKKLWDNVRCPEGRLHEDQFTTYKLLDKARTIVFDKVPLYNYFQRQNSIGHSAFTDKTYDLYKGINEEFNYITNKYVDLTYDLRIARNIWEVVFVNMMIRSGAKNKKIVHIIQKRVRLDMFSILTNPHIPNIRKVEMTLFACNYTLYKNIYAKLMRRKANA